MTPPDATEERYAVLQQLLHISGALLSPGSKEASDLRNPAPKGWWLTRVNVYIANMSELENHHHLGKPSISMGHIQ